MGMKMSEHFQPGDWVIYKKTKFSTHPGPRAENISAAQHGDAYVYTVDKFWIVESTGNGVLTLRTRRGKRHEVKLPALNLHKANIFERWWFRSRFENVEISTSAASSGELAAVKMRGKAG